MFREVKEIYETTSSDFDPNKRIDTSKYNDFSRPEEREVEKHFDPDERAIPSGRTATSCLVKNVETDS